MNEEQKEIFEQKLKDEKIWWCPLPWTHIFSSLSGRYAPCYDAHQPSAVIGLGLATQVLLGIYIKLLDIYK